MPAFNGPTVAEQVAALPPLSQLLGIDLPEEPSSKMKPRGKAPAGRASSPRAAAGGKNASSSPSPSVGVPQPPPSQSPTATVRVLTKLMNVASGALPASSPSAQEDNHLPAVASSSSPTGSGYGFQEWRRVARSLELPIAYRSEEDIRLTLRLLRSLPFFESLVQNELLTLAEAMEVAEVEHAGRVLLRKPLVDDTTDLSTSAGIAAAAMATLPADRPPLRSCPSMSLDVDDSGKQRQLSGDWVMPAEHLFKRFKEQISRGEPPSLPPGCAEKSTGADQDGDVRPITASKARRGVRRFQPQSVMEKRSLVGVTTTPLFLPGEDYSDKDDSKPFTLVLLSGGGRLEWPRQRGLMDDPSEAALWHSYGLQLGDAMGYDLILKALPPGAQYVTSQKSMLLVVSSKGRPSDVVARLRRVCNRANEAVLRSQMQFITRKVRPRLFDEDDTTPGCMYPAPANVDTTASDERRQAEVSNVAAVAATSPATEPAGPSVASLIEHAARNLIPIRIPTEGVLLREGLAPAEECAIYFVVEGGLAVSQRIWSQDQQRLLAERAQLVRKLTPATGVAPTMDSLPGTDIMETARLRPGAYCGELAYLNEDPDNVASLDAEWTAAYWQSTLVEPITNPSQGSRRGDLAQPSRSDLTGSSAAKGGRKSLFRRHRATVVATQASLLYVLLPHAADQVFVGPVLQRMRDHIHSDYSSYRQLFSEYEKLYKWALYKERVLCDVSRKVPVTYR
ncbi:hypothetical protein JKF63_04370 [Porcisia hertigi]|uniref:Uncharacterized protein n=1 Tax=Porcisia hertigi TaxID=2761500 RepID=A0A836I8N4_9TRYP|nr:hypothetical protein JKF63_04370 [Porcisia hertigi]